MENFEDKLKILLEGALTPADHGSSANNRRNKSDGYRVGGATSLKRNEADKGSTFLKADARRKRRERARSKSLTEKKIEPEEAPHPRELLIGEMRLTLKETFLKNLLEYIEERDSEKIFDNIKLLNEYPKLKEWAKKKSTAGMSQNGFSVYCARESMLSEEIGGISYREDGDCHNWFLNKSHAIENLGDDSSYFVMKAKILPDHVLIYIPAFSKDLEDLIYNGKVEDRETNPIRKAKNSTELILPGNINSAIIVETNY